MGAGASCGFLLGPVRAWSPVAQPRQRRPPSAGPEPRRGGFCRIARAGRCEPGRAVNGA
ncbi:hypothetical protein [Lysobacter gummosus]|uniref:hypothetical protein n=1 Tax=Lysobacter gummosus TaxID=262324 RepID=UPI00363526EB